MPAISLVRSGESWTVDALWPRTNVVGTVVDRVNGDIIEIDGKGYRENSWGRYLLSVDGWDFMVFSEESGEGVLLVMQTYHASEKLDFADLSFYDNGELVSERFTPVENSMGWYHRSWRWDGESHSCVPESTVLTLKNERYQVTANIEIGDRQRPMLSNATLGTRIFFIQEHFPTVNGEISRTDTGELVTEFSGQAGGEFAFHKSPSLLPRSEFYCKLWGLSKFSRFLK